MCPSLFCKKFSSCYPRGPTGSLFVSVGVHKTGTPIISRLGFAIPIVPELSPHDCHLMVPPYKESRRARIRQHQIHRPPRLSMITHEIRRAKHKIEMKSWSVLWCLISLFHVAALILIMPKLSTLPPFSKRFLCQGFCQCRRRDEVAAGAEFPHCQGSASRASGGLFIRRRHDRLAQLQPHRRRVKLRAFNVSLMGSRTYIIMHHATRWRATICVGSTWRSWLS